MPIHDWTRVPSGLFHDFQQSWSIRIKDALNAGRLPKGVAALVEQRAGPRESDVLAIERIVRPTSKEIDAVRANRIVVKRNLGRTVAVIEIVSPGNKDSRAALREFVDKILDFLRAGIHVLIVDLFPPTPRDPFGIHMVIWDEIAEQDFTFPKGQDRIVVSYETGDKQAAYIEPVGVGDPLPDMPLFLTNDWHIKRRQNLLSQAWPKSLGFSLASVQADSIVVPLESTYQATWDASPKELRRAVATGVLPEPEAE